MPMTLTTFDALVDAFFDKCKEMYRTKGIDNIKQAPNRLDNFERAAARRGMSPLNIIAIYQDKHRDCIDSYIKNGTLEGSESLEMRFVDDVAYSLLMLAQAIAEGYSPAEDWLTRALTKPPMPSGLTVDPVGADASPTTSPMRIVDAPGQMEKTGQVCCNPGGEDCCDGKDDSEEGTREGDQGEPGR